MLPVVLLVGGLVLFLSRSPGVIEDLPLEALHLRPNGRDNVPDYGEDARFLPRARALAHILPRLSMATGARWTTIFRSESYTDAIYASKYKQATGEDWPGPLRPPRPYDGPSMHSRFLCADDGVDPGPDTYSSLKQREELHRGVPEWGGYIRNVVHEGDHLHFRFHADMLESLGERLLLADAEGAPNV